PDEALDVTQDTFVKACENAARWEPTAEVGPWLTRIAINQSIDQYRRRRRRQGHEESLPEGELQGRLATAGDPSPERQVLGRELGERVDRAVRALPDQQRAIFTLRHYQDLTLEEIAE